MATKVKHQNRIRKGHLYADCPTGQLKVGQQVCNTCAIRKRRESEPDNWYYKPRSWLDVMNAVECRWQSVKTKQSTPVWAGLNAARRDTDPVVWTRQVLLVGCNWGINLDHVPVPLGIVRKRPPKVRVPDVGQFTKANNPQFNALAEVTQPRAAPRALKPPVKAMPGRGFAEQQARLARRIG